MKIFAQTCTLALAMAAGIALTPAPAMALPPESGIGYQGQLFQDGMPVDGMRDFRFQLYDDAVAGNLIQTVEIFNVDVIAGLFSVDIDFGESAWVSNQQFWLQVEAGPADGMQNYEIVSRMKLSATPYALNTRGINVNNSGWVGIGTPIPSRRLHISRDMPFSQSMIGPNTQLMISAPDSAISLVSNDGGGFGSYLEFLDVDQSGNLVDNWELIRTTSTNGSKFFINYGPNSPGPNTAAMAFDSSLRVGIGTQSPNSKLDVRYSNGNGIEVTDTNSGSTAIGVQSTVGAGTGVRGESTAGSGSTFGVYGQVASAAGWGVYSNGRLGASGTKSFMIDHPLDPAGSYLLHYSSESPEPQNRYNGNVHLDGNGRAIVVLPDYFESINADYRYTLTPIGAPAPNLYIESEIQGNAFVIAGGVAGQKISWEVISRRNDEFVKQRGAPIEIQKVGTERGKFLVPSLYGQPEWMGIHFKAPVKADSAPVQSVD